jgi:hypothetical protein
LGSPGLFALFVLAALVLPIRALSDLAKRDFPDRDTRAIRGESLTNLVNRQRRLKPSPQAHPVSLACSPHILPRL